MEIQTFKQGSAQFNFKIMRSKKRRKTIAIHVSKQKGVEIKVPQATISGKILELIEARSQWIIDKLTSLNNQNASKLKAWHEGEDLWYLGKNYPVLQETFPFHKKKAEIRFDQEKFILTLAQNLKVTEQKLISIKTLESWFKDKAVRILTERTLYFSAKMQVLPKRIIIKTQRRRWGSCDCHNNIRYNWKIIMCNQDIIDYLVVHELAHIKFKNHSKKFWDFVASILPDHIQRRKNLKTFGREFILD